MKEHAGKHYAFFSNKSCEFFPCHTGIAEENFNCLFCYCPLYILGRKCGRNFFHSAKGIKVCKHCSFPHKKENYDLMVQKIRRHVLAVGMDSCPAEQAAQTKPDQGEHLQN